jgi:hypothetical protein
MKHQRLLNAPNSARLEAQSNEKFKLKFGNETFLKLEKNRKYNNLHQSNSSTLRTRNQIGLRNIE